MGDLSQARIETVRRLLEESPDSAVQSLEHLLASDGSADPSIRMIREVVSAEGLDRRTRNAAFAPLASLFAPCEGVARLQLPSWIPAQLWRALKLSTPELIAEAVAEAQLDFGDPTAMFDALCRSSAGALTAGATPEFVALGEKLDGRSGDRKRVITLLELTPLLRAAIARLPFWMLNLNGEHDAAIRLTFKDAEAVGEDAGALFMEALFAELDEPAQILRLISILMDRPTDRYLAASELASFGQRLLDHIDTRIDIVRRYDPRRGLEGGVAVASAATIANAEMTEFEQQIALAKEGVWARASSPNVEA